MNVEIRTEAAQFPGKDNINGIFLSVRWKEECKNWSIPIVPLYGSYTREYT